MIIKNNEMVRKNRMKIVIEIKGQDALDLDLKD